MRRWILVVAVVLALAGCDRAAPLGSPAPVASPTPTASPSVAPGGSATPTGTPAALPATCAVSPITVTAPRANRKGPFGVTQVTGSQAVALTFDDGPDPVNTPAMLDVLRACGVKATFCLIGNKVTRYADVVRRIVAEGHTLCNHTWQHNTKLGTYGQELIRQDLQRTNNAIHAVVPGAPIAYFRAPGGEWTADYVSVAHRLGMTPLDWDVDPWDWNFARYGTGQAMTDHIVTDVQAKVRPGSIILSHDNDKPTTVAAYRVLLPWLDARFRLVALPTEPIDLGRG